MTWIPCSYCSIVAFSPIFAKWSLTVMTEGAVGCLLLAEGRFSLGMACGESSAAIMNRKALAAKMDSTGTRQSWNAHDTEKGKNGITESHRVNE